MIENDERCPSTAVTGGGVSSRHETLLVLRGWQSLRWSAGSEQRICLLRSLDADGPYSLTPNELTLVQAVALGCVVKQVAGNVGLRWGAARASISRALQKLGLRRCAQLPAFWHGLSGAASTSRAGDGTELLVFESRLDDHPSPAGVTTAEREVLLEVLLGHDNQQIASLRQTSVRTVANQLAILFRKFGVCSRAELAARALSLEPPLGPCPASGTRLASPSRTAATARLQWMES